MVAWPKDYIDKVLADGSCPTCGLVDCTQLVVTAVASPPVTHILKGPKDDGNYIKVGGKPVEIPPGTKLYVLSVSANGLWYNVTSDQTQLDKAQYAGWILAARGAGLSGTHLGAPYVRADGRDGGTKSAIDFAASCLPAIKPNPAGSRYVKGSFIGKKGDGDDLTTGYSERCLRFMLDCFGIFPERCPQMTNPSLYRPDMTQKASDENASYPISAWGAYNALNDAGKILTAPLPPPAGSMVFWGQSTANGNYGHVAITSDDKGNVISSGAPGKVRPADPAKGEDDKKWEYHLAGLHDDVWPGTLADVTSWTEVGMVGYTTPALAFLPGTWGANDCIAPPTTEKS
jgi:hypothetical protein